MSIFAEFIEAIKTVVNAFEEEDGNGKWQESYGYDEYEEFQGELFYGGRVTDADNEVFKPFGLSLEYVDETRNPETDKTTVYKVTKGDDFCYVGFYGYYDSYESTHNFQKIIEVNPVEKTITQYEKVKK